MPNVGQLRIALLAKAVPEVFSHCFYGSEPLLKERKPKQKRNTKTRGMSTNHQDCLKIEKHAGISQASGLNAAGMFSLVLENIDFSAMDVQKKAILSGLSLVSFRFFASMENGEETFVFNHLLPYLRHQCEEKPMLASNGLYFLRLLIECGRPWHHDLLELTRCHVETLPTNSLAAQEKVLISIKSELQSFKKVVGKWRADTDPLAWTKWDSDYIASGLTALCACFYNIRSHEFYDEDASPNVSSLRNCYKAVSYQVACSTLTAFKLGVQRGRDILLQWLAIAEALRSLHNYHLLMAVQNGWQMHQLDRLNLWRGMSTSALKSKDFLDRLCSVDTRMAGLLQEQEAARQQKAARMIPCMFWLVQKAELLNETPLLCGDADNGVNKDYLVAAHNVFGLLKKMQQLSYGKDVQENEASYYFSQLDPESLEVNSEFLYELSDSIKEMVQLKPKRSSISSFFQRSPSKLSSAETSEEGS